MDSRRPRFKSCLCHGAAGWPWAWQPLNAELLFPDLCGGKMTWNKWDPSTSLSSTVQVRSQQSCYSQKGDGVWLKRENAKCFPVGPLPAGVLRRGVKRLRAPWVLGSVSMRQQMPRVLNSSSVFTTSLKGKWKWFCLKRATSLLLCACFRAVSWLPPASSITVTNGFILAELPRWLRTMMWSPNTSGWTCQLCSLQGVFLWARHFLSVSLHFLTCKMGIQYLSEVCFEE